MTVALTRDGVLTHAVGNNGRTRCGRKVRVTFAHASVETATCQTCNGGDWEATATTRKAPAKLVRTVR